MSSRFVPQGSSDECSFNSGRACFSGSVLIACSKSLYDAISDIAVGNDGSGFIVVLILPNIIPPIVKNATSMLVHESQFPQKSGPGIVGRIPLKHERMGLIGLHVLAIAVAQDAGCHVRRGAILAGIGQTVGVRHPLQSIRMCPIQHALIKSRPLLASAHIDAAHIERLRPLLVHVDRHIRPVGRLRCGVHEDDFPFPQVGLFRHFHLALQNRIELSNVVGDVPARLFKGQVKDE